MQLIHRKSCRVCNSTSLTKVIDLGMQYSQGLFVKEGVQMPPLERFPTALVLCDPSKDKNACGLLQMESTVPKEVLYSNYWYRSGTNNTMRNHLKDIVNEAISILNKNKGLVLDIGCNDGTLLNFYSNNFEKYGIDPSNAISGSKGEFTTIKDFFPSKKLIAELKDKKFDIVTSIAMFYDLEDPLSFAKAVKDILSDKGIWILEMSYMPSMLESNSYDTICQEHLEYYSLSAIKYILAKSELKLFNASFNSINGGSLRCYVTHEKNSAYEDSSFTKNIEKFLWKESLLSLNTIKPYLDFQKKIENHKSELSSLLKSLKKEDKKIHIYGASTKGNTILQWCGIGKEIIDVAADRNPDKYGARTLGSDIPIVSEAESRAMNPDYYLVLPWHFKEEFLLREKETIDRGIGFIFPLPKIEIIHKSKQRVF